MLKHFKMKGLRLKDKQDKYMDIGAKRGVNSKKYWLNV